MSCHSSTLTRDRSRAPSLRSALFALAFVIADAMILSARADEALNARAREVLTTHCAPCREAIGGAALDLAALARDPALIRPGNPDGSPAYTELLRRFGSDAAGPSPDELATLRAWIESLPAQAATCPTATFVPREHIEAELARLAATMKKPVSAYRVLSFAHLDLGCATREQLAEWREMIGLLLAALAGVPHAVPTHVLNARDHHIAFDIQDLGWDAFRWRTVLGVKTQIRRIPGPLIVRADQLVAQVLRGAVGIAHAGPKGPVPPHLADSHLMLDNDRETARAILAPVAPPEKLERHAELILQLARQHLAPVNLHRVAAELGMSSGALVSVLEPAASGERHLLRRLIYGTVLRNDLEDAWALIARLLRVLPPERAVPLVPLDAVRPPVGAVTPIDLTLYPDLPSYTAGDTIEITVRSSVDCYLTVISIDREGYGTVIFPNDFAANNRIAAHLSVTIPAQGARYRLRVKDKGRERIVALCTPMEGRVDGIRHDFERQRFQELGPYAAFLDAHLRQPLPAPESEQKEGVSPPAPAHVPQSQIWRTGIVVEVR